MTAAGAPEVGPRVDQWKTLLSIESAVVEFESLSQRISSMTFDSGIQQ